MIVETASKQDAAPGQALMRVPAARISRVMDLVAELSLSVSETLMSPDLQGLDLSEFETSAHRLRMLVREVQDAASELRLVPVDEVFNRLKRMVREIERETGKRIDLVIQGGETMIDKLVADRLYDPLLHVVRNAADHGLEPTEQRRALGKPEAGRITLSAAQVGNEVEIVVADDGRGLNRDKILNLARQRGFYGPEEEPDDKTLWTVLMQPGFSTAEQVSTLSGRGVGMDVLNAAVRAQRGRLAIDTTPGAGTRVSVYMPTTLAFLDCIVVVQGGRRFALPIEAVAEILTPSAAVVTEIAADNGREVLHLHDRYIPVRRLEQVYHEPLGTTPLAQMICVLAKTSGGLVCLPVDTVEDRQQVVLKPVAGPMARLRASWGYAILGSGDIAIVLDAEGLGPEAAS